ncbi:hypothetical protein JOE11_004964, partial [Robbsia andropogonis]
AQAQAEPEIPPNRAADDDSREAVTVIKRFRFLHHFILPPPSHQPDSALSFAHHRLPDSSSRYFNRSTERICTRSPETITLDGYAASHRAVREMKAEVTICGIELMHRICKGQFDLTKLVLKDAALPAVWDAVLSA